MAALRTKPRVKETADSIPVQNVHHVIDVLEKETEKLQTRFNKNFGDHAICDIRFRYLSIMAICRAGLLCRSIRSMTDEKQIGEMTREFCNIRDALNKFFDSMQQQSERKPYVSTGDKQSVAASR
ncbi:MAG: hypothetical protein ABFD82_20910 [Syntrophaceae bacterium]